MATLKEKNAIEKALAFTLSGRIKNLGKSDFPPEVWDLAEDYVEADWNEQASIAQAIMDARLYERQRMADMLHVEYREDDPVVSDLIAWIDLQDWRK